MIEPGRAHVVNPMTFTLGVYHLVTVYFMGSPLPGIDGAPLVELHYDTVWATENFHRDDIDVLEVQNQYTRHVVGSPVRRLYRSETVQLLSWKGAVRIHQEGSNPDPFLVGFCETFRQAATWVANGRGEPYLPWKDAR